MLSWTQRQCTQGHLHNNASSEYGVCGVYIVKMQHLHLSIFTKNSTCFWLFNSFLWLSRGPHTHVSCSWMVKIERCLPSELSRTAARRKISKNPCRTSCIYLLNIGIHLYGMQDDVSMAWQCPLYSLKFAFSLFTPAFFLAPFSKSPLRSSHSKVFVLPCVFIVLV